MAIQIVNSAPANAPMQEPQFQDWGPIPHFIEIPYNNAVPGIFSPPIITHTIRDMIGLPEFAQYSAFRWGASRHGVTGVAMTLYTPTSAVSLGFPMVFQALTANGTTLTVTHNINTAQLNTMQPGSYSTQLRFVIQGLDSATNTWTNVSTYLFQVTIRLISQAVTFNPQAFIFNHIKGTTFPALQNLTLNGPQWRVSLQSNRFTLASSDPDVLFTDIPLINVRLADGAGSKVLTLGLAPFWDTPAAQTSQLSLSVLFGSQIVATVPIQVNIIESLRLSVNELHFQGIRLVQEPVQQFVAVQAINAFTFTTVPWLIITVSGNGVTVVPIPTVNMQSGTYTATVLFNSTVSGQPVQNTLLVTYVLEDVVSNNYPSQAFTLDQFLHSFSTFNNGTYFNVLAKIKTFDYFSLAENTYEMPTRFPLTQMKRTEVSFGEVLHRLMPSFDVPRFDFIFYRKAELVLEIQERNYETNSLMREFTTQPQTFVAGFSDFFGNGFGFLDPSPEPMRVTKNSKVTLPFTGPNGNYLFTFSADTDVPSNDELLEFPGYLFSIINNEIVQHPFTFENYIPGAKVTLSVNQGLGAPVQREFIVFPEGDESMHIVWETDFKMPHWFEFTGNFRLGTTREQITQRLFKNRVEFLDIVETTKVVKLFINTGFILKSDNRRIDSLMSSKRAWLYFEDGVIELRPLAKELSNFDNKRMLYDFEIEFEIKRAKNEKTYSF